jgi:hypothetical protein
MRGPLLHPHTPRADMRGPLLLYPHTHALFESFISPVCTADQLITLGTVSTLSFSFSLFLSRSLFFLVCFFLLHSFLLLFSLYFCIFIHSDLDSIPLGRESTRGHSA